MRAPISVPITRPRPPNRLVPPMTTAVIESRLASTSGVGARCIDSSDQDPTGDREDQAGDDVDADDHPVVLDAREPGSIGIVADCIDMCSPCRVSQDVREHCVQHQHHDHAGR